MLCLSCPGRDRLTSGKLGKVIVDWNRSHMSASLVAARLTGPCEPNRLQEL
jgi:hypothetical protein